MNIKFLRMTQANFNKFKTDIDTMEQLLKDMPAKMDAQIAVSNFMGKKLVR